MKKPQSASAPAARRRPPVIPIGIIGTGGMAHMHAQSLQAIPGCAVVAACDVDAARAQAFAEKYHIPQVFTDVEELLQRGDVQAVCNVTPDRFHAPVSLQCLRAGKHVLCEKPLATSFPEARRMAQAADQAGVKNLVNFSYRNSSAVQKAAALVAAGELGRILHVEGHYYQDWLCGDHWGHWAATPAWLWRLSTAHGSKGVLGDVGVHLLDFASFPVGPITSVNCLLRTFPKAPNDRIGEYQLDANDSAIITVTFAGGAIGSLQTSRWTTGHRNSIYLAIYGEEGALRIDLDHSWTELEICRVRRRKVGSWKTLRCPATPTIYQRFIRSIRTGHPDQPDFQRGTAIQQALDACEKSHRLGKTISLS